MTNLEVAKAWSRGKRGKSLNMRTDGQDLYSYALRIGFTHEGLKYVILYNRGGKFVSQTTSQHVSYARQVANKEVYPSKVTVEKL